MNAGLINYPVFDLGWMMAPRGVGTMIATLLIGRIVNKVDPRRFILVGFLLTAASLWQMTTEYSLYMGSRPIIFAGLAQGFGLGLTFVPLNLLALSDLPPHIMSQGTALRALMRMLGGLDRHLDPGNPARAEHLDRPFAPCRGAAPGQPDDPHSALCADPEPQHPRRRLTGTAAIGPTIASAGAANTARGQRDSPWGKGGFARYKRTSPA